MSGWRCDRCGKFRRGDDIVEYDVGDQVTHDMVIECRWCMSPATLREFGMDRKDEDDEQ